MNPDMAAMAEIALARGYDVLVLTNAMKPMMRPRVQAALIDLNRRFDDAAHLARQPRSLARRSRTTKNAGRQLRRNARRHEMARRERIPARRRRPLALGR